MASPTTQRRMTRRQSRVIGALLALHAGDSLGASVEFDSHARVAQKYPNGLRDIIGGGPFSWSPGHATDDTDMTRGVLLAYRDFRPGDDIARLAGRHFLNWLGGNWPNRELGSPPRDIGAATGVGLSRFAETGDPDRAGAGKGSAGNGSLMRCIPTALFQLDRKKRIAESIRISKITHDDARCTVACVVYNEIVAALIDGASPEDAVEAGQAAAAEMGNRDAVDVFEAVKRGRGLVIADLAKNGPPPEINGRFGGFVLETLSLGVAAVLDPRSLEDVLVDVVRIGKDTDTNAAVAGGLLGARDGEAAVPGRWKSKLQFADEFQQIALALLTRDKP